MVIIPTFSDPSYAQVSTIDGVDYILTFTWHARASLWRLDLANLEGTNLVTNLPLHVNQDIFARPRLAGLSVPPGMLVVYDSTGGGSDPVLTDFGTGQRCQLIYFAASELAA
jgi:hypothetical protein